MSDFSRTKWSIRMIWRAAKELSKDLSKDLSDYYLSSYPILLVIGAFRRLCRRLKMVWVPKAKGRPVISEEIVNLILDMKRANRGWGVLRISQELALLGIKVSKITVAGILKQNGFVPPRTRMTPISWEAFFNNHKHIWAMDFHCVFDTEGNQVFVLVILDINTRELVSINATLNPNRNWIIQQFCDASISGHTFPTAMIADNDGIYGGWLSPALETLFEIYVHHIPIKQPWKNGRCERLHLTIKSEVLERVDLLNVQHVRDLCVAYQSHYNSNRPHQALEGRNPSPRDTAKTENVRTVDFSYQKTAVTGGLIIEFSIAG